MKEDGYGSYIFKMLRLAVGKMMALCLCLFLVRTTKYQRIKGKRYRRILVALKFVFVVSRYRRGEERRGEVLVTFRLIIKHEIEVLEYG